VKTVEGYDVDRKALTLIGANEMSVFAARPSFATVHPGIHWDASTLLLTDRRMIITKDRLLGKAKADFEVGWAAVRNVQGALWNGGGPQIQLLVHNPQTAQPVELIVQPQHAADVESAIRAGYLKFSPR
jgi:hypothetical protein